MDRTTKEHKEEEQEEKKKENDNKETMDKSAEPSTPTATTILAATNNDDDTSTESSDTFETWTLVTDKQKFVESLIEKDNDANRIEILKNNEPDDEEFDEHQKTIEQKHLQDSLKDVTNDDFSDGISIISESESVGRISPHPYMRDHLYDLNMQFSTTDNMDDEILYRLGQETPIVISTKQAEQQLRKRRRSSGTLDTTTEDQALETSHQTVSLPLDVPPLVKRGLRGIFYIGVGLAILAIIGKIVNPTWKPGVKQPSAASPEHLEQKVIDMELQNNLMRAEIDLLNKQVKHLNSLKDPQQYKGKHKEGKTFKAWSGLGDSLNPVDITKEDLRRPFKCPDGSYVEIANMCVEQKFQHEPSLVDEFGQVVEDMKQQSETFKTFEKVAEELHGLQDKILGQQAPPNEFIKNKPIYQLPEDLKQYHQHKEYQNNAKSKHQEGQKSFGKDNNKHENNHEAHSYGTFEILQDNLKDGLEKLKENFFKFSDYSKESFEKLRGDLKEPFEKLRHHSKETFKKLRDDSKDLFKKYQNPKPNAEYKHGKDNNPENKDSLNKNQESPSHGTFENLQDNLKNGLEKLKENFFKFSDYSKESFEKLRDDSKEIFKKFQNNKHNHKNAKSHDGKKSSGKDNNPENNDNPTKTHEPHSHGTFEEFQDNLKDGLEKLKENFFKFSDYSKESFEKFRENSKEKINKFRDYSKETYDKFHGNSKEKSNGKFDDSQESKEKSSKERFNRHKRQNDNDDSGEWQENYMKHREKQRKQNEQQYQDNQKNWYIKRGDSRENKRSGEKQYR